MAILFNFFKGVIMRKLYLTILAIINTFFILSMQTIFASGEVTISHYFSGDLGKLIYERCAEI